MTDLSAPPGDEWLDHVDDNDQVIGKILRSETMLRPFKHFRVVNAFIRNTKGEIWVPVRGPNKRIFPNCLDCSVGGHVGAGEGYELSFFRETEEEVGLNLHVTPWKYLGALNPLEHPVSAFMRVYEIYSDAVPPYNTDDFSSYSWLSPKALMDKIAQGTPAKGDLGTLVRHFYGNNPSC